MRSPCYPTAIFRGGEDPHRPFGSARRGQYRRPVPPRGDCPEPLLSLVKDTVRQTGALQKSPVAVHHRSACSGVKALRNTSVARRQAAKLGYRFGPLTPSARSANLIAGDGTKNGLSRSEQKTVSTTQNNRLTGKAPYKFESRFLQRRIMSQK